MTKRIVAVRADGGISIICPTPKTTHTIEEIKTKDSPAGSTSYIVEASNVPTDRSFRNAWTYTP